MEWIHYVLLGLIPAIAAFGGTIVVAAAKVWREHQEDMQLLEEFSLKLADEEDPLTPEEFKEMVLQIKREFGESKEAWKELWLEIKKAVQQKK